MLHQYPCGRIVSFIGLFGAAPAGGPIHPVASVQCP